MNKPPGKNEPTGYPEFAVRAQTCFAAKDYATILAIVGHSPANVIEEDEQLQMMHDMAEMRAQG